LLRCSRKWVVREKIRSWREDLWAEEHGITGGERKAVYMIHEVAV
jgi:hypothetical protein